MLLIWILLRFALLLTLRPSEISVLSCESPVYCYGEMLHSIQLSGLYSDSKTFVDLKIKYSVNKTYEDFKNLAGYPNPFRPELRLFVSDHFEQGKELENWTLPDFKPEPNFMQQIANETVKNFTKELISIWPKLAKKVKGEVKESPEQYSLIFIPNGFIIPGGRFREYYYWDSYWIIDGLLISEMGETVRGMIDNLLSLVNRFGFVPNGGRIYYLNRSQPPLLTSMAYLYYKHTKDTTWLKQNIDILAKELNYWANKTVLIKRGRLTYTLAHYSVESEGPRPESYKEDIHTAFSLEDPHQKQQLYNELKSGAESGWDYSGRWIIGDTKDNRANLSHIQIKRVIPVDLNAFLCGAYREISEMYDIINNSTNRDIWKKNYNQMKKSIQNVLWDGSDGIWHDYDIKLDKHRRFFYPSSVTPLWSKCFDEGESKMLGKSVLDYFNKQKLLEYPGGVPTSNDYTNEQWDFPNAWPPLQHIIVKGLENSGYEEAKVKAAVLAARWINSNLIGYLERGVMYEKYHVEYPGSHGVGGEYKAQSGFGWSNGVALRFIYDYYRVESPNSGRTIPTCISLLLLLLFINLCTYVLN